MKMIIGSSSDSIIQPFKKKSEMFSRMAKIEVDLPSRQCNQLIDCKKAFRKTLEFFEKYWNHSPKTGRNDDCTPRKFFALWSTFAVGFEDFWGRKTHKFMIRSVVKNKMLNTWMKHI